MGILLKIFGFLFRGEVQSISNLIERNINCAPVCCEQPMEYIGEHSGHRLNTQFYQCQTCKRVELSHKHDWEKV